MSGSHSRTKGHAFERQVAIDFQELGWDDAMTRRAARGGDWSTTDHGIDIVNVEPFAVQCKRLKAYAPITAIEQIREAVEMEAATVPRSTWCRSS